MWLRRNFVKMFDAGKTRMIGRPYGEKKCDNMLSRFHLIPERYGQTDERTELLYQYRPSACWLGIKIFETNSVSVWTVCSIKSYNKCSKCSLSALTQAHNRFAFVYCRLDNTLGVPVEILPWCLVWKTGMKWLGLFDGNDTIIRFDRIHEHDGQTDGHTNIHRMTA